MVFEKMKTLIPHKSCQKFRCDSEFTIVKNFANKTVYLNSTASDIFMLCEGKKSIDDICYPNMTLLVKLFKKIS